MMATMGVGMLLMLVGNVLLGVAVWRSGTLPKWAGALWAAGSALPVLGMLYALLPIGADATPAIVPVGAVLLVIRRGVDGLQRPAPDLPPKRLE
jgi:ABC-type proline/glycine betaine transport system permease subunit